VLNGVTPAESNEPAGSRFIAPGARILIVDDISTNLRVAEGLMALYQTEIHTCTGGEQAIALVKKYSYDIVFMDHMMPGMDGIEATAAIRALEHSTAGEASAKTQLPIVALTANAISGMKEMFLEKGFNDYLTKPIEFSKLEEIMLRWIPKTKQVKRHGEIPFETGSAAIIIPGVDTELGIMRSGGTEAAYRRVLFAFRHDALERLHIFESVPDTDISLFVTNIHAIKSAAANIGARSLSEKAVEMETAGKRGDINFIRTQLAGFYKNLKTMAQNISGVLEAEAAHSSAQNKKLESEHRDLLLQLKIMLEKGNIREVNRILTESESHLDSTGAKAIIENISEQILLAEYEGAVRMIDEAIT
jgi:CheY-like chemotaxis protein